MTFEIYDITVKRGLRSCALYGATEKGRELLVKTLEDRGTGIFTVPTELVNELVSDLLKIDGSLKIRFFGR